MRILFVILLICNVLIARNNFSADHFVKKHNLKLPQITKEMLDISKHTHKSDTWEYFHIGKSTKIDSVYRLMDLQAFPANKTYEKYSYKKDSIIVRSIHIAQDNGDTTVNNIVTYTDNYKSKTYYDLKNGCYTFVTFTSWGNRISEKRQCPGDKEPTGQEFVLSDQGDYLESLEYYKEKVDSNTIRRYYFTSFDSLVADYMVKKEKEPFLVHLITYTKDKKVKIDYSFGIFSNINEVVKMDFNTYNSKGLLYRKYLFMVESLRSEKKEFELANYTEYEYDSLGRKIKMTTRVIPDPKYQKK